jgi:hypothetical protein
MQAMAATEHWWDAASWGTWCGDQRGTASGRVVKAALPLFESRLRDAEAVKAFTAKRPAASVMKRPAASHLNRQPSAKPLRKRTPFSLKRGGSLIVGGVKRRIA